MSTAVLEALTYPPRDAPPDLPAANRSVLVTFLDTLLGELPWWNRAWRVAEVGALRSSSSSRGLAPGAMQVVEVTVPGSLSGDGGEVRPFSARVRFLEDRLLRWQLKVGDMVIGPAVAPVGKPEPHPFGAVYQMLAEMRGLSLQEMARRTRRAEATIRRLRAGDLVPERALIEELAQALDVRAADLAAIAGVELAGPGRTEG